MAKQNTMIGAIQSSRKGEPRISIPRMTPDAPKPQLRRVSPGVYRNNSGDLVGSRGQRLPGQRQPGQMPNDIFENLRRLIGDLAPSSPPQQRRSQPGVASGSNGPRTIQPWERARFGIDPRDPNTHWVMPDGGIGSTLIGWWPNAMPMDFPKIPTAPTTNDFLKRLRG